MRPSLSLKTLLRTPLKALLTVLLLAVASFALFSRVSEYAITTREMERATSYYTGIGYLDTGVPYTTGMNETSHFYEPILSPPAITEAQIKAIESLPEVISTDTRYMTAGISDSYNRLDLTNNPSYNYTTRFIMEGTFDNYAETEKWYTPEISQIRHLLKFTECKLLSGYRSVIPYDDNYYFVEIYPDMANPEIGWFGGGNAGRTVYAIKDNPFRQSFIDTLNKDSRYLIIGRGDPWFPESLYLGDIDTMDYCPSFWELDGKPDNYLETEEFASVRQLIEITDSDMRTYDMVYTSDMSSIPRFADNKMTIRLGRALTEKDLGANVCVVNQWFLMLNKLEIGDKITIGLGGKLLEQNLAMGAVACTPERYSPPVETVELEIVGAYIDMDLVGDQSNYIHLNYTASTIFVPSTLLPVAPLEAHEVKPGEFSFVIGGGGNIEAFLSKIASLEEELGLTIRFNDGGWSDVSKNIQSSSNLSLINTMMFIFAAAISLLLAVYMFIGRGKKEYAIMRALGAPHPTAQRTLLVRLGVLAGIGIPVGAVIGLISTSQSVTSALADLAAAVTSDYVPDTSLPYAVIATCVLGEIAFLALSSGLMLRMLGKVRPLELLQGSGNKNKRKGRTRPLPGDEILSAGMSVDAPSASGIPLPAKMLNEVLADIPSDRSYNTTRHVISYIKRHIRRTGWKPALILLLTVLMTGAMGLFAVMRLSYENLLSSIEITCYVKDIASNVAVEATTEKIIKKPYYKGSIDVVCNIDKELGGGGAEMILSNDLERSLEGLEATVQYAEGYDSSFMSVSGAQQCVIGSGLAEWLSVSLGDEIKLLGDKRYMAYFGIYEIPELKKRVEADSIAYKVAGIVSSESEDVRYSIYAPAGRGAEAVYGGKFTMQVGEFVLADNGKVEELRAYAEKMISQSLRFSPFVSYTMDTAKLEDIIRIRDLLELLFPIAVAAAVITGFIAPGMIVIQSAKEAAILRVLGTTKKRTRCILVLEQIFLCIVGLIIAAAGLIIYDTKMFMEAWKTLIICGGLFLLGCTLGVWMASAAVTRRRALELLQTKE